MPDISASLPPGTQPPANVTTRKVFLNNTELSNEISLVQVTINKSFNKISYAKLVFIDGSAADRDFPLSNDDKFKPGSEIKIQLGFNGEAETVFEGIVVKHGIKIRTQGGSLLMLEAKDKAIKLTGARKSAYYINKTDHDVLTDLAGELQKDIDPTTFSHKQLVQYDCTDWDFILTRAEANGMLVFTDDGKLVAKNRCSLPHPFLPQHTGRTSGNSKPKWMHAGTRNRYRHSTGIIRNSNCWKPLPVPPTLQRTVIFLLPSSAQCSARK